MPGAKLDLRVDLEEKDSAWEGTIDIPAQAVRGFKLGSLSIQGSQVGFVMPKVFGEPKFDGQLADDGRTITGTFSQTGLKFPFSLTRTTRKEQAGETPTKGIPGTGLPGHWQGSLRIPPGMELRLALEVTEKEGQRKVVLISLDQGASRIPAEVTIDGAKVHLKAASIGGKFDGQMSPDGAEIGGEWQQLGPKLPLTFRRLAQAPKSGRPQDPVKPYPYAEEEVTVANGEIKLAGTLTLPAGPGPHPAAVLITGSGPQDRDEALMGHRPFLVLADHLTRQGIAVLRYDDRGVAKSTGDFSQATHADFVTDALAAVSWLKTRKEIDGRRIGLIGHSEGGIVAPLAAAQRPEDIAYLVLLAGVGVRVEQLMVRQVEDSARLAGATEEQFSKLTAASRDLYQKLNTATDSAAATQLAHEYLGKLAAEYSPEQQAALGLTESMLALQTKTITSPWFRQLIAYDPRPALAQVKCPVLAINGEKDVQVAAKENLEGIREAVLAGGNREVKVLSFPGLNHLFQTCTSGAVGEYGQIEETFAPAALEAVSSWIREHTRP